jgi:hypothetical protein
MAIAAFDSEKLTEFVVSHGGVLSIAIQSYLKG